jgi:hypothetical protein
MCNLQFEIPSVSEDAGSHLYRRSVSALPRGVNNPG